MTLVEVRPDDMLELCAQPESDKYKPWPWLFAELIRKLLSRNN